MSIKPIIFSAPMVRALLEGRKTQTRRIIKPRPWNADGDTVNISIAKSAAYVQGADAQWYYSFEHPLGGPLTAYVSTFNRGDLLYVREAFATDNVVVRYAATDDIHELRKVKPSIHMPRWASRLTLAVTEVRVQRLQEISEEDAIAEGVCGDEEFQPASKYFEELWNSIHGKGAWAQNPWVVAVTFVVHKINVDKLVDKGEMGEAA